MVIFQISFANALMVNIIWSWSRTIPRETFTSFNPGIRVYILTFLSAHAAMHLSICRYRLISPAFTSSISAQAKSLSLKCLLRRMELLTSPSPLLTPVLICFLTPIARGIPEVQLIGTIRTSTERESHEQ